MSLKPLTDAINDVIDNVGGHWRVGWVLDREQFVDDLAKRIARLAREAPPAGEVQRAKA